MDGFRAGRPHRRVVVALGLAVAVSASQQSAAKGAGNAGAEGNDSQAAEPSPASSENGSDSAPAQGTEKLAAEPAPAAESNEREDAQGNEAAADSEAGANGGQPKEASAPSADNNETGSESDSSSGPPPPAKHTSYGGVQPGHGKPIPSRWRRKTAYPLITWTGFQPRADGSARLFVQLSKDVDPMQSVVDQTLLVTLPEARFGTRSTLRRLVTQYFGTAVAEVTMKRLRKRRRHGDTPAQKAGAQLRIRFVNPADASRARASVRREADGYTYLYLDFDPPGTAGNRSGVPATSEGDGATVTTQ